MWTDVHLTVHIVWDDVLWNVSAIWREEADTEPIVLYKRGRVAHDSEGGPDEALAAAVRALQGVALSEER